MHITCCACAYQLLCKRTTAVVRPKILTFSTTYTMFFNNISVIFQQKEGESLTYDTPSFYLCFHIESLSNKKSNTSINTMPSSFWYFLMRSPVITYTTLVNENTGEVWLIGYVFIDTLRRIPAPCYGA